MSNIQEIDSVLQFVRHLALEYNMPKATLSQQILLLGDSFYGYRFVSEDFTAVWSAADNTVKFFDVNGRCLSVCEAGGDAANIVPFPAEEPMSQRKAA